MKPKDIQGGLEKAVQSLPPSVTQPLLVTMISAAIGALTTWAIAVDQRLTNLTGSHATRQDLRDADAATEKRVNEIYHMLRSLERRLDSHIEKTK